MNLYESVTRNLQESSPANDQINVILDFIDGEKWAPHDIEDLKALVCDYLDDSYKRDEVRDAQTEENIREIIKPIRMDFLRQYADEEDLTESYDESTWEKYQQQIESIIKSAKGEMDENTFLDFCDGAINLIQNYTGVLNQYDESAEKLTEAYNDNIIQMLYQSFQNYKGDLEAFVKDKLNFFTDEAVKQLIDLLNRNKEEQAAATIAKLRNIH